MSNDKRPSADGADSPTSSPTTVEDAAAEPKTPSTPEIASPAVDPPRPRNGGGRGTLGRKIKNYLN
jgi:hypothetical protein